MAEQIFAEWNLPTRLLGRRTRVFPSLESTNTYALSLADDPANDGLAILAREQTAGRGQHGRSWLAPPGSSVLLSVLLFPPSRLCRPAVLTALAGVSVCEVIHGAIGFLPKLKWPNDVLVADEKVCGILIEQRASATVIGIGLNVTQPGSYFIEHDLPSGASLASISGQAHDTESIAERLLKRLDSEYDRLCQGDTATLKARWIERLALVGKQASVIGNQENMEGRVVEVTFDAVVLEKVQGGTVRLRPETIRGIDPFPR